MKQIGYEVVWTTKRGSRRKVVSTLREVIELFAYFTFEVLNPRHKQASNALSLYS